MIGLSKIFNEKNKLHKAFIYNVICFLLAATDLLGVFAIAQMTTILLHLPINYSQFHELSRMEIFFIILLRLISMGFFSYILNLITLKNFDKKLSNCLLSDNKQMFLNFNNSSEIDAKYGVSRWGYINTYVIPKNNLTIEIYTALILLTVLIASAGFMIISVFTIFVLIMGLIYLGVKFYSKYLSKIRFDLEQQNSHQIQDFYHLRYFMWDLAIRDYFISRYISLLTKISKVTASEHLSINSSRYFLEAIISLGLLILVMTSSADYIDNNIMLLILGVMRLMPSVIRISSSFQSIALSSQFRKLFEFDNESELTPNVNLRYENGNYVLSLKNYNYFDSLINEEIKFPLGSIVVIDGKSGAGKSYLFDSIISALSKSSSPSFGYMPQDTPLCNGGIVENILIGRVRNDSNLCYVLDKSGLKFEFTPEALTKNRNFNLPIDKLSGGQRKRLGLARCLYNEPEYLFLDEPTSGLDANSADSICNGLSKLDFKIMFIISHDDNVKSIGTNFIRLDRNNATMEIC